MTELVVDPQALEDATGWRAQGHTLPVAVDLSPPTFADRGLPTRIESRPCTATDCPPSASDRRDHRGLRAGQPGSRPHRTRRSLQAWEIRVSIDDFGSGYSALSYLRELPIDEVKLDRSFIAPMITDPGAAAIVPFGHRPVPHSGADHRRRRRQKRRHRRCIKSIRMRHGARPPLQPAAHHRRPHETTPQSKKSICCPRLSAPGRRGFASSGGGAPSRRSGPATSACSTAQVDSAMLCFHR